MADEKNNTGDWNTGSWNTGSWNTGSCNTGKWNTGKWNSGNCNTGNCNAGNWNTGSWNTGSCNTGDWNTGSWNTGDSNTGKWNSGNCNTGNCNTGKWNTGNWNTGNCNTGFFNRDEPKTIRVFEKEIDREEWDNAEKPDFLYFKLTEWIPEDDVTDEEKEAHKETYGCCGGYLKSYTYLEAFRKSWDNATIEDRRKVLALPGFDNEIFKKISGIDAKKELAIKEEIIVGGVTYVKKRG